jgi:hypothetical protein
MKFYDARDPTRSQQLGACHTCTQSWPFESDTSPGSQTQRTFVLYLAPCGGLRIQAHQVVSEGRAYHKPLQVSEVRLQIHDLAIFGGRFGIKTLSNYRLFKLFIYTGGL